MAAWDAKQDIDALGPKAANIGSDGVQTYDNITQMLAEADVFMPLISHMLHVSTDTGRHNQPQVPQMAAIFHNDCWHLASQLLVLPHCYSPRFEQLIGEDTAFVAAALQLRQEGSACLARQVTVALPSSLCLQIC